MKYMTKRQALTIALLAAGALCGTASAQEVGKASAVNPAATANLRTITIGSSIAHKERIQTTAAGSVQLLFLDKTSMTIGPNSDLTIDEYVYNPNAGAGKLAATLGKGALRFVGGQISHSGDAEVKTASAVIGIRGGVALITPKNVFNGYGSSTVTSGGSTVTLYAGEFTQTQGGGTPPTPPGAPPAGFVAAQIQTFQSTGGQTGGVAPGTGSPAALNRAQIKPTGPPPRDALPACPRWGSCVSQRRGASYNGTPVFYGGVFNKPAEPNFNNRDPVRADINPVDRYDPDRESDCCPTALSTAIWRGCFCANVDQLLQS